MRIDTLGVVMKEMVAKNMAICLCFSIGLCQAQYVFIPDPAMRDWLNTNIPGVVDGSGFMDTTYAGIAGFTNGTIDAFFPWDQQDLTGIQYLDGLITLEITTLNTDLYLPGFPMALEALTISGYGGTSLPPLPASLTHLNLDIAASLADLPALPSGLVSISLYYLDSLTTLPMLPVGLTSLRLETRSEERRVGKECCR